MPGDTASLLVCLRHSCTTPTAYQVTEASPVALKMRDRALERENLNSGRHNDKQSIIFFFVMQSKE